MDGLTLVRNTTISTTRRDAGDPARGRDSNCPCRSSTGARRATRAPRRSTCSRWPGSRERGRARAQRGARGLPRLPHGLRPGAPLPRRGRAAAQVHHRRDAAALQRHADQRVRTAGRRARRWRPSTARSRRCAISGSPTPICRRRSAAPRRRRQRARIGEPPAKAPPGRRWRRGGRRIEPAPRFTTCIRRSELDHGSQQLSLPAPPPTAVAAAVSSRRGAGGRARSRCCSAGPTPCRRWFRKRVAPTTPSSR